MSVHTLPDTPNFFFLPSHDEETDIHQIRMVVEDMRAHVATSLIVPGLDTALSVCDRLNRRLGYDREAWLALAAASAQQKHDDLEGGPLH